MNISNVFLLFFILIYFILMSDSYLKCLTLLKVCISLFFLFNTLMVLLKVFYYTAVMYFLAINYTVVLFSVKQIELLDVRNALYK